MVGELYMTYEELMKFYGQSMDECHLPFNFKLLAIPWKPENVRSFVNEYQIPSTRTLGGQKNFYKFLLTTKKI